MSCNCESPAVCGCCEGPRILTPREISNRPGLDTLAVRIGTHASFFETMKARLASTDFPALRDLTTRASDDPTNALMDAWATAADVLTFYTERIANEGYLRTATERRSVLELARLIGYRPRPGVAASVFLAFTVDTGAALEIPAGQAARSVPAPGTSDLPQTFETSHPLKARAELNRLRPRMSVPQEITPENVFNLSEIYLQGTALNLKPNDLLVFAFASDADSLAVRRVQSVVVDQENKRTKVVFKLELLSVPFFVGKMKTGLAVLKRSAAFDAGKPELIERKLVTDASASADKLELKLTGNRKLMDLDQDVGAALNEEIGVETKEKFRVIGDAIIFLAGAAGDLLTKSAEAMQAVTEGRVALFERFHAQALGFQIDLAGLRGALKVLKAIGTLPPPTPEDIDSANKALIMPPSLEILVPTVKKAKAALTTLTDVSATITDVEAILPTGAAETDLDSVLAAIVSSNGPDIEPLIRLVFDPAPTAGSSIEKIKNSAGLPAKLVSMLGQFRDNAVGAFNALRATAATVEKLDPKFDPKNADKSIEELIAVKRIFGPCHAYSGAQEKITKPALAEIAYAVAFDKNAGKLEQPPKANPDETEFFRAFVRLGAAVESLRETLRELRRAFITRARGIIGRYGVLATSSPDVFKSLQALLAAFAAANVDDSATGSLSALQAQFGSDDEQADKKIRGPLDVLREQLRTAKPPLRQTLLRLRAELRGLVSQVSVAPILARPAALDVTAIGGGLETLRSQIGGLQLTPAGDPLSVEVGLSDSFRADTRQASDMIARTVATFGGVSEDAFFAAWRQFRSGEVDARVYALRQKTGVFGNNASRGEDLGSDKTHPDFSARFKEPEGKDDWTLRPDDVASKIALESEIPQVIEGGYVAVQLPDQDEIVPYRIKAVHSGPRSVYGITGKSTEVTLEGVDDWGKGYVQPRRSTATSRNFDQIIMAFAVAQIRGPTGPKGSTDDFVPLFDLIRRTVVYAHSEQLPLAEAPVLRDIGPAEAGTGESVDTVIGEGETTIMLDGLFQGIDAGRRLVIAGERADGVTGARLSEAMLVARVEHVLIPSAREKDTAEAGKGEPLPRAGDTPHTRVILSEALAFPYKRETVEIFGNVVDATHGETGRGETLGNGDARLEFQRFELKQPPLTFTAAPTPAGAESTLAVRVNDVLWHEVESFDGLGAADRNSSPKPTMMEKRASFSATAGRVRGCRPAWKT